MNAEIVRQKTGEWMIARGWRRKLAKRRPEFTLSETEGSPAR